MPLYGHLVQKRSELLDRFRAGERPPQIAVSCYFSRTEMLKKLFRNMWQLDALYWNGLYANDQTLKLLTDVLHTMEQIRRTHPTS